MWSLPTEAYSPLPLDMFLLFIAQGGAYLYSIFSIVGAYLLLRHSEESAGRSTAALRVLVVEVRRVDINMTHIEQESFRALLVTMVVFSCLGKYTKIYK